MIFKICVNLLLWFDDICRGWGRNQFVSLRPDKFSMLLFAVLENLIKILEIAGDGAGDEYTKDKKDIDFNHLEFQDEWPEPATIQNLLQPINYDLTYSLSLSFFHLYFQSSSRIFSISITSFYHFLNQVYTFKNENIKSCHEKCPFQTDKLLLLIFYGSRSW